MWQKCNEHGDNVILVNSRFTYLAIASKANEILKIYRYVNGFFTKLAFYFISDFRAITAKNFKASVLPYCRSINETYIIWNMFDVNETVRF